MVKLRNKRVYLSGVETTTEEQQIKEDYKYVGQI